MTGELQLDELLLGLSDCYNQATTMLDRITKEANKSTAGNKDAAAHNSRTVNGKAWSYNCSCCQFESKLGLPLYLAAGLSVIT